MKQKFTTGMLLISAVLLGAFIWFVERSGETTQQKQQERITLFNVHPESIYRLEMERGDVRIECSKASGEWRLVKPADAPVNQAVVEQMIAGMSAVERGELILSETLDERGMSASDYGFDEPRARITYENNLGTFTWLIGRDAPIGDRLYVMSEESGDIISAPKTLLNLIPEDPAWIRDRTLFKSPAGSVRRMDLRRAAGFLQLSQAEDNGWRMQQPHEGPADRLSVNTLIDKILSARIGKFITDQQTDLTIYGLEDPAFELTLFSEDGGTQTLLIGKPLPEHPEARYAKWSDSSSVFAVASDWAAELELDSDSLRDRQLVNGEFDRLDRLTITSGETQTELIRTNGQWQVTRPARWDTDAEAVNRVLDALASSVILEFADNPDTNQTAQILNPAHIITYSAAGKEHTLRISEPRADGSLMIQRDEEASFGIIAAELFDRSFWDPLFYRSRSVLKVDPESIRAVTLSADDREFRIEKSAGRYAAADRAQRANTNALSELTGELTDLRAQRYVALSPESLSAYGLENPGARLSITLSGTNILGRVLLFGNDAEDGRYAMLQGQPIVFVLPEHSAKALTKELTQPLEKETAETKQP